MDTNTIQVAAKRLRTEANNFRDMISISTPNAKLEEHSQALDAIAKELESSLGTANSTPILEAPDFRTSLEDVAAAPLEGE